MRIVILGGGFSGLNAAQRFGQLLERGSHEIILVADSPSFIYRPSLFWVALGKRDKDDISVPLKPALDKAGVHFLLNKAVQLLPRENKVAFQDQTVLEYDILILATGALPDYGEIEGLLGNTSSIYQLDDALRMKERIKGLAPGSSIVFGVAPGNTNPALVYEFTFELHAFLGQQHRNMAFTFFTFEQQLFEQAGEKASALIEKHMQEKEIVHLTNKMLTKVDQEQILFSDGTSLPYSLSMIVPPYRGADYIFLSEGLEHDNGLIQVHPTLQSVQWENIYAIGDTNVILGKTIIQNGRAAELQGRLVAENISSRLLGQGEQKEYQDSFAGLMELGSDGGMFAIKDPTIKIGSSFIHWAADGAIPHWMKLAFEKYYLWYKL